MPNREYGNTTVVPLSSSKSPSQKICQTETAHQVWDSFSNYPKKKNHEFSENSYPIKKKKRKKEKDPNVLETPILVQATDIRFIGLHVSLRPYQKVTASNSKNPQNLRKQKSSKLSL